MGSNQTSDNAELIYQNYQIIDNQNDTKILRDRKTNEQFILKQQSFVLKSEYDRQFKLISQRQKQSRSYENILKLVKLWSKQQNGICSNLMKIYSVYQFPIHNLRQEIKTRKNANEPFQQGEIVSILQTCINVVITEPSFLNISPEYIFVDQNGVLKLIHPDLMEKNFESIYCQDLYYSPQKIEKFQREINSKQQRQKQAIFSIGMTALQAIILDKLNVCYQVNMKRINRKKLDHYKTKLSHQVSQKLSSIIIKMLEYSQKDRVTFRQISKLLEQMSSEDLSIHSFNDVPQTQTIIKPITEKKNADCYLNLPLFTQKKIEGASVGQLASNHKENTPTSYVNPIRRSQFEILFQNQSDLSLKRQLKNCEAGPLSTAIPVFTDNKILYMIKDGLEKIKRSRREALSQIKRNNQPEAYQTSQSVKSSCQDILSQIVANSQQKQQLYLVQQYQDQSKYEGNIINSMKNGFGKLIYPDGVYYQGNFKDDNLNGKGALFYGLNRPAYIGQWLQNKFHGYGTLYNEYSTVLQGYFDFSDFNKIGDHWIKFQGYFKYDLKEGRGKITLTNGQIIEASFDKGVINGQGTFRDMNGKIIKGYWKQNKLVHLHSL